MGLLASGNSKLGLGIWSWSVPAVETCPGSTVTCRELCYAMKGHFNWPSTHTRLARNLSALNAKTFIGHILGEISLNAIRVVRIHVAGDFDRVRTIRAWHTIASRAPRTVFFAYTRSWSVARLVPSLRELAMLPNMRLWLSCDRETGKPPAWKRTRRAYLMLDDADVPGYHTDLVFRERPKTPMNHAPNGALVCRYETGGAIDRLTCTRCRLCFLEKKIPVLGESLIAPHSDAVLA